jgi:hypothetical protein
VKLRRLILRLYSRLLMLSGWTWVAAGSVIGFEAFDILFMSFALAPEFLPLAIIALALYWLMRERMLAVRKRIRVRLRAARANRLEPGGATELRP